jgi:hypothetical protein
MCISETKEFPYEVSNEANKEILFMISSTNQTTSYSLNMTGSLCTSDYFSCYTDVNILTDLQVKKTPNCSERGKV